MKEEPKHAWNAWADNSQLKWWRAILLWLLLFISSNGSINETVCRLLWQETEEASQMKTENEIVFNDTPPFAI